LRGRRRLNAQSSIAKLEGNEGRREEGGGKEEGGRRREEGRDTVERLVPIITVFTLFAVHGGGIL
jgi:hypothetical protein